MKDDENAIDETCEKRRSAGETVSKMHKNRNKQKKFRVVIIMVYLWLTINIVGRIDRGVWNNLPDEPVLAKQVYLLYNIYTEIYLFPFTGLNIRENLSNSGVNYKEKLTDKICIVMVIFKTYSVILEFNLVIYTWRWSF